MEDKKHVPNSKPAFVRHLLTVMVPSTDSMNLFMADSPLRQETSSVPPSSWLRVGVQAWYLLRQAGVDTHAIVD